MYNRRDFLSCDWGTTSFRLRWISGADQQVSREIRGPMGSRALYDQAAALGDTSAAGRARVFSGHLREKLASWDGLATEPLPLVISGMASSTIGWVELPYATVPFRLNGQDVGTRPVSWEAPPWIQLTLLISGVRTESDMMRGEETEAIGLMADPALASCQHSALLILPGSHSKHLAIQEGAVTDFHTYLTGELFDVLAGHSLLKATTDLSALNQPLSPTARQAFADGVETARRLGWAAGLFRTRTRGVLERRSSAENTWYLSGVLIGGELLDVADCSSHIVLAGAGTLGELYSIALQLLRSKPPEPRVLSASQVERAAVLGHELILTRFMP